MPVGITIELKIRDLAETIKKLRKEEKEELLLLLSGEAREIVQRLRDIKVKKIKTLTRKEILKDVF